MPRPAVLVMDGAAGLLAEAGVGLHVVKVKVIALKVVKLVLSEIQFPGDVTPVDGEGIVMFWGEGHGVMVK